MSSQDTPAPELQSDFPMLIVKTVKGYHVQVGDRWEDRLTQDEALFAVATWIIQGSAHWLSGAKDHIAREKLYAPRTEGMGW